MPTRRSTVVRWACALLSALVVTGVAPAQARTPGQETSADAESIVLPGPQPPVVADPSLVPAAPGWDEGMWTSTVRGTAWFWWSRRDVDGPAIVEWGLHLWRVSGDEYSYVASQTLGPTSDGVPFNGLVPGAQYVAVAYGVSDAGSGPWSVLSEPVTPPDHPGAPTMGTPNGGPGAARVRWSPPADDGGSPVTGYVVKAYQGWTLVKTVHVPADARDARISGLVNGRAHSFLVQATTAVGTSLHSTRSVKVTPFAKPSAPRIGKPRDAKNAARVYWAAPTDNGGAYVSAYVIKVYQGTRGIKSVTVSGSKRSVLVTGLRRKSLYSFTVTARTRYGSGPPSLRSFPAVPR